MNEYSLLVASLVSSSIGAAAIGIGVGVGVGALLLMVIIHAVLGVSLTVRQHKKK